MPEVVSYITQMLRNTIRFLEKVYTYDQLRLHQVSLSLENGGWSWRWVGHFYFRRPGRRVKRLVVYVPLGIGLLRVCGIPLKLC